MAQGTFLAGSGTLGADGTLCAKPQNPHIYYLITRDTFGICMVARTTNEKLADQLLLLYQIKDASQYFCFLSETKLQKLVFLTEKSMLDKHEKGFNYNYIKLSFGTYSPELRTDLNKLVQLGLIGCQWHHPTSLVLSILKDFEDLFKRNYNFTKKIEEINKTYAGMELNKLLDVVGDMPHPYLKTTKKIRDLKLRTPLLYRILQEQAKNSFEITPEEIATLEIYFDPESLESLVSANESAKKTPLLKFEEVFG